ncbi:MAG: Tol-Pal system beta propeller repeat protein TolB [Gammaproteobacteria bacterium]|nr:MAG: Tol-Pal system beta propeller repeat protein TolB [Gammaproteobacteria bacterium]
MGRGRHRWLAALACAALLAFSGMAAAELRIEISEGVEKAVPVAIVPFGWEGELSAPADVAGIIAADLARSGRFAPIPVADMLQRPTAGREVDFDDWRILGVEYLVVGRLLPAGEDFTIQFQLFDVLRGRQLLGYRQPARRRLLRATVHRVADMLYEELTGVPGVFGTRIAYVTVSGGPDARHYRLVVADADGENARVLVDSPAPLMSPAWSPDGRKLAYVSFERDHSEIYVQELRSGARQRVSARRGVNSAPAWSPDGRYLALTLSRQDGNLDIYTLELATQLLKRLTRHPAIDTEADWSSDGRWLYFTSDRGGGPQIYRIAADGSGRPERVSFEGSYNARPRVSPAAEQLAVVHNDRGNYRIATIDLRRATLQVLTDGRLDESPSFAPNGETLIYATRQGNRGVLATVTVDGRIRQRITALEGDVREPAWSPFPAN